MMGLNKELPDLFIRLKGEKRDRTCTKPIVLFHILLYISNCLLYQIYPMESTQISRFCVNSRKCSIFSDRDKQR